MKQKCIKIGLVLFCTLIVGLFYFWYQNVNYNSDFTYEKLDDGTLRLSKYNGDGPIVNIPEKVRGRGVTRIGEQSFYREGGISDLQVYIPDTVTVIEKEAFTGCRNLTITGAQNVRELLHLAFARCSFATPYPFSENLRMIDTGVFIYAEGIEPVHLGENLEYIGILAFQNAGLKNIEIPENVSFIGVNAFRYTEWYDAQERYVTVGQNILIKCPEEETIVIPEGVRMVSLSHALENENLKNIYIPRSAKIIENPIVNKPVNEISIYIPAEVTVIEAPAVPHNEMVLDGMNKTTFIVEKDSYAETYAKEMAEKYGAKYKIMDKIEYPE